MVSVIWVKINQLEVSTCVGRCTHTRASAPTQGRTRAHALATLYPVADTMRFHPYPISYKPDGRKPVTNKINDMEKKLSVHEKAIRLLEGGIVDVDGYSVSLVVIPDSIESCYHCVMDCLCHIGSEMCDVCIKCVEISKKNCILELVTSSNNRSWKQNRNIHVAPDVFTEWRTNPCPIYAVGQGCGQRTLTKKIVGTWVLHLIINGN